MTLIFLELLPVGFLQSLILALVAMGVMIPFRFLNFSDLTSEGTYPLGGCLCACLLVHGMSPLLATTLAVFVCGVTGLFTALIHLKLKVNTLLAGIILATILYSVNLRLMGKPSLALFSQATLFSELTEQLDIRIMLMSVLDLILLFLFYIFLKTEKGLRLRSVGLNPSVAKKQGVRVNSYIFLGLFLGNALAGLAGVLMIQNQGYADVGMGVGIVIHALASLMIGESLLGTKTVLRQCLSPLLGALIYQQIQGVAIASGLAPSDLKMMTGVIVLLAIGLRQIREKQNFKMSY